MTTRLHTLLKNTTKPLILDGAQGTYLESHGFNYADTRLWASYPFLQNPEFFTKESKEDEIMRSMYKEFSDHDAQLLTTISYQFSYSSCQIEKPDITVEEYQDMIRKVVEYTKKQVPEGKFLVGSIGAYATFHGSYSEYSGDYGDASIIDFAKYYKPQYEAMLHHKDVDLISFETIPNIYELRATLKMVGEGSDADDKVICVAMCINDKMLLRDGTSLQVVAEEFKKYPKVVAGFNCFAMKLVDPLVKEWFTYGATNDVMIYPNSGEGWCDGNWIKDETTNVNWNDIAESCSKYPQVKIIGGCCRTSPEDIQTLHKWFHSH